MNDWVNIFCNRFNMLCCASMICFHAVQKQIYVLSLNFEKELREFQHSRMLKYLMKKFYQNSYYTAETREQLISHQMRILDCHLSLANMYKIAKSWCWSIVVRCWYSAIQIFILLLLKTAVNQNLWVSDKKSI